MDKIFYISGESSPLDAAKGAALAAGASEPRATDGAAAAPGTSESVSDTEGACAAPGASGPFAPSGRPTVLPGQRAYLWLGSAAELAALGEEERAAALAPYKVWTNLPSPPCGHFGYEHPSGYCWGGAVEDWLALEDSPNCFDAVDGDIFAFLVVTRPLSADEEERLLALWARHGIAALCVVDRGLGGGAAAMGERPQSGQGPCDEAPNGEHAICASGPEGDGGGLTPADSFDCDGGPFSSIDLTFLADFYDDLEEERILCFAPPDIGYLPIGAFLSFHPVSNTIIWSNYGVD